MTTTRSPLLKTEGDWTGRVVEGLSTSSVSATSALWGVSQEALLDTPMMLLLRMLVVVLRRKVLSGPAPRSTTLGLLIVRTLLPDCKLSL